MSAISGPRLSCKDYAVRFQPCPFSIGMLKISTQPILARAFIAYAVSKDSAPVLRQSHLEPVTVTH